MTIEYKDSKRIVGLSTDTVGLSFEDDYTSNTGWTQTGSKVTVDSGKSDWVDANAAATNDSLQQVIKSLGITLSDTAWTADFTYINNGGTVGGYPFVFQSGTGNYDSASNDAITMSEDNPNKIKINTKNGGTYVAGSSTIAVSSGTTYYIRIQRTSATDIKLSAFTDSARTTHTSGSPVTASNAGIANITGLTYVQHQNQTTGGGGTSNFEITDLKIYNNLTSIESKPTDVQDNSILVEKDTGKRYWFSVESTSSPVSHSGGTSGTIDASGIDCNGSNPRGGWGQQVKTGHPLVGKSLKTLTVSTRFSLEPANRVDRDMTVKVFAGLNTATIRGTSDAISTSTLITAGTYYEKTFTFATPVPISADDCILVCIDGITGTTRSWNCKIRDGTNEDNGKGYWVTFNSANFPPSNAVQTNRSMIYTATYVTVSPATWTYPPDGIDSSGQIAQLSGSNASNSYTAASEFYTISTDTWDSAFNVSGGGRARAGSAGSTEHAYLMGGQNGSGYFSTIDKVAWADKTNTTISRSTRAWGGAVQNAVSVCVGQSYYYGSYQTGINEYTYGTMAETSQGNTSSSHAFGGSFGNSTYGFVINGQNTGIERYTYSDKSKTASGFTASPTTTNSGGHTGNSTTGISINNTAGSGNARYDSYNISADTWTTNSATSSTPYEAGRASGSSTWNLWSTQTNTSSARQCEKYNYSSGALSSFTSVATNLDGGDQDAGASSINTGVNS